MLTDVLAKIPEKGAKKPLSVRCVDFLRSHSVEESLIEILEACAYQHPVRIGHILLYRLSEIDGENDDGPNQRCLEHGFLIVGAGLNGDPVVVELSTRRMAFVAHDELWEEPDAEFEGMVVQTPLDFDEFWTRAQCDPDFPRDCRDAEEKWSAAESV